MYDVITSCTKSEFLDTLLAYLRKNNLNFSTTIIPKARLFGRNSLTSRTWDVSTYMYKDSADKYDVYKIYFGRYGAFNSDTLTNILKVFVDQKTGKVIQIDNNSISTILPDMFKKNTVENNSENDLESLIKKIYDKYVIKHIKNIRIALLDNDAIELEDQDLLFLWRLVKDKNYMAAYLLYGINAWVEETFKNQTKEFRDNKFFELVDAAKRVFSLDLFNVDQDKADQQDDKIQKLGKKYWSND